MHSPHSESKLLMKSDLDWRWKPRWLWMRDRYKYGLM
jgi:hypothetical protein